MSSRRTFEHRHVVGFEETNLVGNVYYVNHLRWQGRCREMFLRRHCPELLERIGKDLLLTTTRCSCDYYAQLRAFDEVVLRMQLAEITRYRITMAFDYMRSGKDGEELVARGEQQIACMQPEGEGATPVAVPAELAAALAPFGR